MNSKVVFIATILSFAGWLVWAWLHTPPYDDTDSPPERSQMRLHTDAATGCQYLSVVGGGITPRMTATGQHMGCKHD